ncbi:MAG: transcriptional regulator [Sphaerochaetaceae bacterium]
MKYYDELLKLGLFSKEDIVFIVGNPDTGKTLLRNYAQKGYIARIKHNYYAVKSLETKQPILDRYAIGSCVNEGSYISHHSAFEYYGMANQVFTEVSVSSSQAFKNFSYEGVDYIWRKSPFETGVISPVKWIRVTDIERTIVDSIRDFFKIGGLEELLRCLDMVTLVDETKLTAYLATYDTQFLYQKTGYILSHFKKMKLSSSFFTMCQSHIGKSVRYLSPDIKYEQPVYHVPWQLYGPADLLKMLNKGVVADV